MEDVASIGVSALLRIGLLHNHSLLYVSVASAVSLCRDQHATNPLYL